MPLGFLVLLDSYKSVNVTVMQCYLCISGFELPSQKGMYKCALYLNCFTGIHGTALLICTEGSDYFFICFERDKYNFLSLDKMR